MSTTSSADGVGTFECWSESPSALSPSGLGAAGGMFFSSESPPSAPTPGFWSVRVVSSMLAGYPGGPGDNRQLSATIASISTFAPFGSAETATATRAGGAVGKNSAYTSLTSAKSPMSVR